jgi:hypothetical protein
MAVNLRFVCLILGGMAIRRLSRVHRGRLFTTPFRANFRITDDTFPTARRRASRERIVASVIGQLRNQGISERRPTGRQPILSPTLTDS